MEYVKLDDLMEATRKATGKPDKPLIPDQSEAWPKPVFEYIDTSMIVDGHKIGDMEYAPKDVRWRKGGYRHSVRAVTAIAQLSHAPVG